MNSTYCALAHAFTVETFLPALDTYLTEILAPLVGPPTGPVHDYTLCRCADGAAFALTVDGHELWRGPTPAGAVSCLLTEINLRAVASRPELTILHAGAVEVEHGALVLPGPSGTGKTTMVTALLRRGARYLSDELAPLDREHRVTPFPKSLSIDDDAWHLAADLAPTDTGEARPLLPRQWHVPAHQTGAATSSGAVISALVFPRFAPGAPASVVPLPPLETVRRLIASTFDFDLAPQRHLRVVARLAHDVPAWELTSGSPADAAAAAMQLLEAPRVTKEPSWHIHVTA